MQKTVLIVEDEFLIAMDLKSLVEGHGWHVMGPVATVRAALSLLKVELPSVGLLDVNLGKEFVTPVAEALKERNVPFLLASAYDTPELYGSEILAGVPNVGKPADERLLLKALDKLVDASHRRPPRPVVEHRRSGP